MDVEISAGMARAEEGAVSGELLASAMGSGTLDVLATPAMIALMEKAAANLAQENLPEGWTSVGTKISIEHTSATPPGMKIRAVAEVMETEGRKVSFEVRAFDEAGEIGRGVHERVIVETEKFLARAAAKKGGSK